VTPNGSTSAVLEASGISKAFGPVQALDGVSLALRPGEIVALAGENGSGKSTFARILAGVMSPDEGDIHVEGRRLEFGRPNDAIDGGIAMVSQEPMSVPGMSIAENVLLHELHRPARRFRRHDVATRAGAHLRQVGLGVDPHAPFASLRQGEAELAEVARALSTDPKVLILDEATTRLPDPEELFGVLEHLVAERQLAVVLITHRLREIRRLCDRAVVLRDGALVGELGCDELSDERISAMMVGRELSDFFAKPDVDLGAPVLRLSGVVTDRSHHPVSLTVRSGEVVGLAGLVGSGRSELLETIAGVRARHGGEVRVGETDLDGDSVGEALRAGVVLVPEDRWGQGLIRHDTITTNLALAGHAPLRRTRRRHDRKTANEAVLRYRVRCQDVETPVGALSGGNAQKVVLARGVNRTPAVLLLDEPTRGIDIGAKSEIYHVIADMVARGVGVLVASSDLLELLGICDRILVLHDGEVAGEVPRDEASEERLAYLIAGGGKA
jgi:ABC-type sugar transport system ATPase subunit